MVCAAVLTWVCLSSFTQPARAQTIEYDLTVDYQTVNYTGGIRFQVGSGIDLTARSHFGWTIDTDEEWELDLEYILMKNVSLVGSYDSDYGAGLGAEFRF